jgi:hypothetical protein
LPVLMRRPTTTESETHVVLFTAGFLGRGFDSRRLHQIYTSLGFEMKKKHIKSDGEPYWCGSAEVGEGVAMEWGNSALPSRPNTNN